MAKKKATSVQSVRVDKTKNTSSTVTEIKSSKTSTKPTPNTVATQNKDISTKAMSVAVIPRGKPKSGRLWKTVRTERHSSIKKVKSLKTSWAEKMEKRKDNQHFKELKNRLKQEKANAKELKRQRTEENKKRRLANQRKAEIVQVIKDTSKIKRMRKKQLRTVETR